MFNQYILLYLFKFPNFSLFFIFCKITFQLVIILSNKDCQFYFICCFILFPVCWIYTRNILYLVLVPTLFGGFHPYWGRPKHRFGIIVSTNKSSILVRVVHCKLCFWFVLFKTPEDSTSQWVSMYPTIPACTFFLFSFKTFSLPFWLTRKEQSYIQRSVMCILTSPSCLIDQHPLWRFL